MCKNSVIILIFGSIILTSVNGSGLGRCPNYPSMPKFNMSQFVGQWHEVERAFYLPEIASSCTLLSFEENEDSQNNTKIEVTVASVNQWTGNPSASTGAATRDDAKSSILEFQFQSRLPSALARFLPGNGKYQVLFSDYNNFAILYSCSNFGFAFTDQIWILGRELDFTLEIRKRIYDILKELGLDSDRLRLSKNNDCPTSLADYLK